MFDFGSLSLVEQETVISRCRADNNILYVYSSDSRVINRILKKYGSESIKKHYFSKKKELLALSIEIEVKDFLKSVFLPIWRGSE